MLERRFPGIAKGKWKLLVNADGSDVQLYDISKDQYETTNLVNKYPLITKRLKAEALAWRRSVPGAIEPTITAEDQDCAPDS